MSEEPPIRKIGPYGVEIGSEALDKARQRAEAIKSILHTDEFMRATEDLLAEIKSARLAKRFSTTEGVNSLYDLAQGSLTPNPGFKGLTEAERKKQGLEFALRRIQNELLVLDNSVEALILDFEVSKEEWDKPPEAK